MCTGWGSLLVSCGSRCLENAGRDPNALHQHYSINLPVLLSRAVVGCVGERGATDEVSLSSQAFVHVARALTHGQLMLGNPVVPLDLVLHGDCPREVAITLRRQWHLRFGSMEKCRNKTRNDHIKTRPGRTMMPLCWKPTLCSVCAFFSVGGALILTDSPPVLHESHTEAVQETEGPSF